MDIVETRRWVELGYSWFPVWCLSQRTALRLAQHPGDRVLLDQIPERKAGLITSSCRASAHTAIC